MTDSGWLEGEQADAMLGDLLAAPTSWVEARTNARGVVTWTVHVGGNDLVAGVDRAREAIDRATARKRTPTTHLGSALVEVDR